MRILREYNGDERLLFIIPAENELSGGKLGEEGYQKGEQNFKNEGVVSSAMVYRVSSKICSRML